MTAVEALNAAKQSPGLVFALPVSRDDPKYFVSVTGWVADPRSGVYSFWVCDYSEHGRKLRLLGGWSIPPEVVIEPWKTITLEELIARTIEENAEIELFTKKAK